MRLPTIEGVIRRRLLLNFRVDPEVMARQLPTPFAPKLHEGHAIAGICLIRLEAIRPLGFPSAVGVSSENAAHRVAVRWVSEGESREGVFIPRRDTDSLLNQVAGGRVFPGEHHAADFEVEETPESVSLRMAARDGGAAVEVSASVAPGLPAGSCFSSVEDALLSSSPGPWATRRRAIPTNSTVSCCVRAPGSSSPSTCGRSDPATSPTRLAFPRARWPSTTACS